MDHNPAPAAPATSIDPEWVVEDPQPVGERAAGGGLHLDPDGVLSAVKVAWDAVVDMAHVTSARRFMGGPALLHAASLKPWGVALPWCWAQEAAVEIYRPHSLALLPAAVVDPGEAVDAMQDRMRTDRLKASRILTEWFADLARDPVGAGLMLATAYALTGPREAMVSDLWARAIAEPRRIFNIV